MKNLGLVSLVLMVTACAHVNESPKTVQFPYASELLEKVQKSVGRLPASSLDEELTQKSPRRIYFSALYQQYLTMGQFIGKKSQIKFCPQFHHDKIETEAGNVPKVSMFKTDSVEDAGRVYFPELAFSKDFSLSDYHKAIKSELNVLCEEGISDNFFKFDNLVTHYSDKRSFHQNPGAMASVLKIPVFANFYLIKMLEVPGTHETSQEEKQFIRLTKTHWFDSYITEASRMRSHFIKNKMVRR